MAWTAVLCVAPLLSVGASPVIAQSEQSATSSAEQVDPLLQIVDEAITRTKRRHMDFQVNTPWQIMHGLIALREDYYLKNGDKMVRALDYISNDARYLGDRWFEKTPYGGRAHPYDGTPYHFEGHVNQTLAIIALSNPPLNYQFHVSDTETVTMADMVRNAQMMVSDREEFTFTLWFLTHYLDPEAEWTNAKGEAWSMERLVRWQTAASHLGAPCGGTHGLFALAYARNAYYQKHGELRGAWLEADQKIQNYIGYAQSMQNRDGSFATGFFKSPGYSRDFSERIKSSGHMLEWLMMALPRRRLDEQWVRNGIYALSRDLINNSATPTDQVGGLYHSLHALILYRQHIDPQSRPTSPLQEWNIVREPVDTRTSQTTPDASKTPTESATEPAVKTQTVAIEKDPAEPSPTDDKQIEKNSDEKLSSETNSPVDAKPTVHEPAPAEPIAESSPTEQPLAAPDLKTPQPQVAQSSETVTMPVTTQAVENHKAPRTEANPTVVNQPLSAEAQATPKTAQPLPLLPIRKATASQSAQGDQTPQKPRVSARPVSGSR